MSRRYRNGLGGRWKNQPGAEHKPITLEELEALPLGAVLSFDVGRIKVSAVKHHAERFTLHSRTIRLDVLAGLPAARRILRTSAVKEHGA